MSWRPISLGDCIELVSGAAFKSTMFTDNKDDIPLVKGENIGQGKILWDKSRYWPATQFEEYSKLVLKPNDIVLAMDRPWVMAGLKYAIISDRDPVSLLVQRVARIRPLPNADAKFLKHVIGSKDFLEYIKGVMGGTNVPHISGRQIRDFKCQLPDLETQQRIVSILSAYDDLIENNRRRIALLEEAARQLYKEWFVRFRFPGHEHVKIIDGVPEGWERIPASYVLHVFSGGTPKTTTPQFWDGHIGFFTPKDAVQGAYVSVTEKTITEEGLAKCNSKLYPKDTLFITARGTVGKMNLALVPMAMNQSCYALVSKSCLSQRLLYLTMDASLNQFRSQASGAVFDAIIVATFDRISVIYPDAKIAEAFDDVINPIFDQIGNLGKQTEQLARARDLLLPKLMSGAIAV